MHMVFGRRGFFGYAVRPSGETYWFSNVPERDEPKRSERSPSNAEYFRRRLHEVHVDDPAEVRRIVDALTDGVGVYPIADLSAIPNWHRGRVCILGDAAHAIGPHAGQGASLALEDAFVVARCLRDIPDRSSAFAEFERLRRPRVDPVVRFARQTAQRKAPSGWLGRKVRDLVLPVFLRKGAQAAQALYQYPLDWDSPVRGIRL
jgi:2-polyprenyl-6-methoxyphenol hydroxylase-like FAD-dependent oxidoreductase